MTFCKCGHYEHAPVIKGAWTGFAHPGSYDAVAYDCSRCGTSRTIPWSKATQQQRAQALLAEKERFAEQGMI